MLNSPTDSIDTNKTDPTSTPRPKPGSGPDAGTFSVPPLHLRPPLPTLLRHHAIHSPAHPLFRFHSHQHAVRTITWAEAARAFARVARLPPASARPGAVIAVLAATDSITYFTIIAGLIAAGYVPFPLSPRLPPSALAHLILETRCTVLLASRDAPMQALTRAVQVLTTGKSGAGLEMLRIPEFGELYGVCEDGVDTGANGNTDLSIVEGNTDVDDNAPCVILHSSGSSALPNAITYSHRVVREHGLLPHYGEVDLCGRAFSAHAVPMFHLMGFITIPWSATTGVVIAVFPPPDPADATATTSPPPPPTPARVLTHARATRCALLFCAPTFLETWAQDPADVRALQDFDAVLFAGGPLQRAVGDKLVAEGVRVVPLFGMTEIGAISIIIPLRVPDEGWHWLRTSPHVDVTFVPVFTAPGEEGDGSGSEVHVYRLVVRECATHTPAVFTDASAGARSFDTRDLVVRHPHNATLWRVFGRDDEQITHSTGEKTNPAPIESEIMRDPRIAAALMFGRARPYAGVLLIPAAGAIPKSNSNSNPGWEEEFKRAVWSTIERVNEHVPRHARILRDMIVVTDPARPLERTGKGTLRRGAVLAEYAREIAAAYHDEEGAEEGGQTERGLNGHATTKEVNSDVAVPVNGTHSRTKYEEDEDDASLQVLDLISATAFVRRIVQRSGGLSASMRDGDDIFSMGADSLSATAIRRALVRAFPAGVRSRVPADVVFRLPTIVALGAFVYGVALSTGFGLKDVGVDDRPLRSTPKTNGDKTEGDDDGFEWPASAEVGQTILKLRKGHGEPPLIVLHGAAGSVIAFSPLREKFRSAVWVIQITPDVPLTSIRAQTEFYFQKIKEQQPHGPYRLAAYSASSILLLVLARLFEEAGDRLTQLVMLDHFPTLFLYGVDTSLTTIDTSTFMRMSIRHVCAMMRRDGGGNTSAVRLRVLADEVWDVFERREAPASSVKFYRILERYLGAVLEFMLSDEFRDKEGRWSMETLVKWMQSVRTPLSVYVASRGVIESVAKEDLAEWADLGARRVFPHANIIHVEGGHFEFLADDNLIKSLQEGYV